jgi:hypothetical protein
MIASSFKSVGWVAGVGAAALGCYMLSLQVAAERADLAGVERRIVATQQAIRNLQTELGTRGRLTQLESWNADVLALAAPAAGQYVENDLMLARFETHNEELGGGAQIRMASAEIPATLDAPQAPATVRQAVAAPAATAAPVVRRASLTTSAPAAVARTEAKPAPVRTAATAAVEPAPRPAARQAAPIRAASLLDERTARALSDTARAERAARPDRRRPAPTTSVAARARQGSAED